MIGAPSTQSIQSVRSLQHIQPPKALQKQFLQPLMRMESLIRANPDKIDMQAEKKVENALLKAAPVAALLTGPTAARAYTLTPTLANLLKSIAAGGVVVLVAGAAIIAVSNLDPVSRS